MVVLVILIVLVAAILGVVFFTKNRLYAYVSTEKICIFVKIGFVKIPVYPVRSGKLKKLSQDDKITEFGITSFRDLWQDNSTALKNTLLRLKKRVLVEKLNFEYDCGFSDAAVTAIMYGVVNGLYYNVFAFLDRNFKVKEMQGRITPDFNVNKKHIALDAVFRLSVTDILYIVAALLPVIKNIKKNYKKGGALNG